MTHNFQSRLLRAAVATSVTALALTGVAWASRSSDLQQKISELSSRASQPGPASMNPKQRDAADAGTSLIIETLNDSSLDADAVNENVHIMANNAEVDDQSAAKVCN
jgi:hypothetical protein